MAEEKELLDGTRTSIEWQDKAGALCVLPIGTFEQHSRHLPLACDNIQVTYFGEFIARALGAALLPAMNYATSLEQTGFKGTVTLRPETLMRVVRDIADEVEGQGFRTLIVVNGHGGNYVLGPVARDINRRNRALKILLVDWWAFCDDGVLECPRLGKPDVHAGEFETSVMLALCPGLVKADCVDIRPTVEGFRQSDLNTFGIGYVAPEGAFGSPSLATREKGEKLVASIKKNLLPHIRARLDWLDKNRTYSGKRLDEA